MSAPEEIERLEGGCHCGDVRFAVTVRDWTLVDCNCSICSKKGMLHLIVPEADFELLTGEGGLVEYRFGTRTARHLFCGRCGIHAFYRPRSHPDHWDVNARCLDGEVLGRFEVSAFDGRHWEENVASLRGEAPA